MIALVERLAHAGVADLADAAADIGLSGLVLLRREPEVRACEGANGRKILSRAVRSDLNLQEQITAKGATWFDRQLLARELVTSGGGFGAEG